jgi:hypothetical protein
VAVVSGACREWVYDWTAIALDPTGLPDGWGHWLPVRQQTTPAEGKTTVERAYYRIAAVPHRAAAGATPATRGTTVSRYGCMSLAAVGAGKREWRAA